MRDWFLLWTFELGVLFTLFNSRKFFSSPVELETFTRTWLKFRAREKLFEAVDPCDCDHEWSQNKTETTQQSRVNKRIPKYPHNVACSCCLWWCAWCSSVDTKNGRWKRYLHSILINAIGYTPSQPVLSILLFRAVRRQSTKIFITHFSVCFRIFYTTRTQLPTTLRKRIEDLCKKAARKKKQNSPSLDAAAVVGKEKKKKKRKEELPSF